jgi:hypothetical protein
VKFILAHEEARRRAVAAVQAAPVGDVVDIGPPTRTKMQNAAMWPLLDAFAEQLWWPIMVCGVPIETKIDADDWKNLLTAAFRRENLRIAPGINGGMVMLGSRTSVMKKREFSDFLDFIHATAADRGVTLARIATPQPESP